MDRLRFAQAATGLGLSLGEEQLDRFEAFEEALYAANEVMNLTRVPREECETRHFLDSILFQDLVKEGADVLDVGTGPGFPAFPLACARPDLDVMALDSSGKMLGFLAANAPHNLTTLNVRMEDWGVQEAFDVVTGRALAPLAIQLELGAAALKLGGLLIPMRTPSDAEEARQLPVGKLGLRLHALHERALPGTDVVRLFPVYRKVKETPEGYPRKWAEIKRSPLGSRPTPDARR